VPTGLRAHPSPGQPPLRRRRAPRLVIMCAVRRYGFMHHMPPSNASHMYLAIADSVVLYDVYSILGVPRKYKYMIKLMALALSPRSLGDSTYCSLR
jgi:hypothetical protein